MTAHLLARDLRYAWPGGPAVGPVDLDLGPGLWHVSGRNGSGKTTLLRLLCGQLRPDGGEVRVLGRDPLSPDVRRHVALLPAEPELPGFLTVEEAWRTLAALRSRPGWDGATLAHELGLPPRLRLEAASAGQRRKAELVATLAGDPEVLLLDEPTAGLDAGSVELLGRWMTAWRRDRVVVVTTHEPLPVAPDASAPLEPGQRVVLAGR